MQYDYQMGFNILGWRGEVIDYMKKRLKGVATFKAVNLNNINNMNREYLSLLGSKKFKKADIESGTGDLVKWTPQTYKMARVISDRLNVNNLLVLNFFLALYNLSRAGTIPFKVWSPVEFAASERAKGKLTVQKGILGKAGTMFKRAQFGLLPLAVAGGLIGGVILMQKNK